MIFFGPFLLSLFFVLTDGEKCPDKLSRHNAEKQDEAQGETQKINLKRDTEIVLSDSKNIDISDDAQIGEKNYDEPQYEEMEHFKKERNGESKHGEHFNGDSSSESESIKSSEEYKYSEEEEESKGRRMQIDWSNPPWRKPKRTFRRKSHGRQWMTG